MIDFDALWRLKDSLVQPQTKQTRFSATYSHTDQNGIPWVKVAGSEELSPVTGSLSATMEQGQTVELETRDGTLYVAGNSSDPSQGSNAARAAQRVLNEGIRAAKVAAAMADNVAKQAKRVADAIDQHFWTDGSGVHVTEAEQADFEETPTGRNILMNAYGILLRDGENWLSSFTEGATAFYDGLGNEAANIVAQFGADGATVGYADEAHTSIGADYFRMEDASGTPIIEVTTENGPDGLADVNITFVNPYSTAPFLIGSAHDIAEIIGLYEVLGDGTYGDLIEVPTFESPDNHKVLKISTVLTVGKTYTVKCRTLDTLFTATLGTRATEADGWSYPTGDGSVVLGRDSIASAGASIAAGEHVVSNYSAQVALGRYNAIDPNGDYALIVGNGTADDARSNALAVGWDGTIETARDRDTTTWTDVLSSKSSDINITGFKLAQRGQVVSLWIRFQRTTATSAGAAITVGTLSTAYRPLVEAAAPATTGAGDAYVLESGSVMYRPQSQLAANTNAYVRVTYLVA